MSEEGGREGGGGREDNILSDYDFFLFWPGEWHWPYATNLKIMQAIGTAWSTTLKSDSQPLARSICMLSYAMPTITTCNTSCQDCATPTAMFCHLPAIYPKLRAMPWQPHVRLQLLQHASAGLPPRNISPTIFLAGVPETTSRGNSVTEDTEKQKA